MSIQQSLLEPVHGATTDIALTAVLKGGKVAIEGDRSPVSLSKDEPPRRFNFNLTDNTGLGVQFKSLDTQDNWSKCPPAAGENSSQITGTTIAPDGLSAAFTDNNGNKGQMAVCYQWNFQCSDASKLPITFDPIINNGGRS